MRGELQVQMIELNILNIESLAADKGWSSEVDVKRWANSSSPYKKKTIHEVLHLASDWVGCFLGQSPSWVPEDVYYIIILKNIHRIHKGCHLVIKSLQLDSGTINSESILNRWSNWIRQLLYLQADDERVIEIQADQL